MDFKRLYQSHLTRAPADYDNDHSCPERRLLCLHYSITWCQTTGLPNTPKPCTPTGSQNPAAKRPLGAVADVMGELRAGPFDRRPHTMSRLRTLTTAPTRGRLNPNRRRGATLAARPDVSRAPLVDRRDLPGDPRDVPL